MKKKPLPITLTVNGVSHNLQVAPNHTLLKVLREQLELTGSKECCGAGECGACTVLLDGRAVNSCLVLAVEADGCQVVTIEGLAGTEKLDPLIDSFVEKGAIQCGFCTPGMILSAKYVLLQHPHPTLEQVQKGLEGNLCRCGGYRRIAEAVLAAAEAEDK
jgi:carbon-monoxide dehydrogenase small subunit